MASIAPMRLEDVPVCLTLIAEAWSGHVAEIARADLLQMFAPGFSPIYYTARTAEGVIAGFGGYTATWINHGVHTLLYVCTAVGYRRRGIATALVERCIADVAVLDSNLIITTNVPDFYSRIGFVVLDPHVICAGKANALMLRRCQGSAAAVLQPGGA